MNEKRNKAKFISAIILPIAVAFLAVLIALVSLTTVSANAAIGGDTTYPTTGDKVIEVLLDLNGQSSSSIEQVDTAFDRNQGNVRRTIGISAIRDKADISDTYTTISELLNPASDFIECEITNGSAIKLEAKKVIDEAYISLTLTNASSGNPTTVFLKVSVTSTVNKLRDKAGQYGDRRRIMVGSRESDSEENPYVISLTNNTTNTFYLEETSSVSQSAFNNSMLAGHRLYATPQDTSFNRNDYGDLIKDADESSPWTISDLSSYEIVSGGVTIEGLNSGYKFEIINIAGRSPIIQYSINITSSDLPRLEAEKEKFWDTAYRLVVEVRQPDQSNTNLEFCFLVKFVPSDKPVARIEFNMPTNLNAGVSSDNIFEAENMRGSTNTRGYGSTVVSAKHLVEYPNKNSFQIYYADIPTDDSKSADIVEISSKKINGTDGNYDYMDPGEEYYIITAKANGVGNVEFGISYKGPMDTEEDDLRTDVIVRVAFNVYGKYTVNTIQLGGKAMSENINSYTEFNTLRREGYVLTGVSVANTEFATATIDKMNLVITPRATGVTDIIYTFLASDGITQIDVVSKLDVDLNRGNWWRMQQDWAKALIIAAAVIVGIAIILFIVWLFIRGVNKSKREEQETVVPTSSYIVKLNSTIAAAQAQQRYSYGGVAAPTQTLQLGAGTTSAAPPPDLNALPPTSGAAIPPANDAVMTPPPPPDTSTAATQQQPASDDIYIPISDEDLLERIFVEKYEPRGMTRRSFFKSKDLQSRELEKEKARIREDVKNGMSIEEACKSEKQREEEAAAGGAPVIDTTEEAEQKVDPLIIILGFDPSSPLMTPDEEFAIVMGDGPKTHTEIDENGEEKVVYDELSEEEEALNLARTDYQKLTRESEILGERLSKSEQEKENLENGIGADKEKIEAANADIKALQEKITDLEIKLSSARGKEKDRVSREIAETEEKINADKEQIKTLEDTIAENEELLGRLGGVIDSLKAQTQDNSSALVANEQRLKECEKQAQIAAERAEKARAARNFDRQYTFLSPLMENVAVIDKKMGTLGSQIEQDSQWKTELKSEVSALQTQLLGTTDATAISNMSEAIKQKNADIAQIEKNITSATKEKSDLAIELSGYRKQANEFIEKEDMTYEKVVEAEDKVLNRLALDEMREKAEKDKQEAEDALMLSQTVYDELVANMDASLAEKAASVADDLKLAEEAVQTAQAELDEMNAKMEAASDDEKLMMSIDQMSLVERVEELTATLENLRANGIKANLEFKMKSEEDIKEAGEALEKAKADYESANDRINRFMNFGEATDLIVSGSGIISRDKKAADEANLKKKLEEQQNAIEQAKMQAKLAQEEAERAISDAEKASAASKEEAERLAQEAIERAESARLEAEAKAAEEAERAKAEIDKVRAEAAEEAEKARTEAEKMLEEAEKNRKEAESEAERARREAEEEAIRARRAAEEEAERAQKEAEKAQQEADEAAEKARKEAEEAEKANAAQQAEKDARIAEKVRQRKLEIAELRRGLKTIETETQGNELKEKFYDIQLRLDDDEKESQELKELLDRSMNDAAHAAELARYKALANKAPKRIVKKVTERVNKVPRKKPGTKSGSRSAARPGARPAGARPAARPGARPGTRPAARPGTRSAGSRPATRRPSGTRPSGTRPSSGTTRRPPNR